ncbi:hypothetical protein [Janibacter anophelis]|uniref:hypothetical protein n=1 Tax=Janibacter anophelis TaxID=319054 RepID=UPI000A6BE65D|nr:hypothetical protein [Janibacter anophelis]
MATDARPLLADLDALVASHLPVYEDLHRHPELSFQEERTAGIVADRLHDLGCDIPRALDVPSLFWIWGGFDPQTYRTAEAEGTLAQTIPGNHASTVAPVAEPTLRTGMSAMPVALMAYLAKGA